MTDCLPFAVDGQWYRGNLHCHTTISDGVLTPEQVVQRYRDNGYDFLALTDHDVLTDWRQYESVNFIIIPGIETEIDDRRNDRCYHIVGIQDRTPAPGKMTHLAQPCLRSLGGEGTAQAVIDVMNARGMSTIFCHPVWSKTELADFQNLHSYFGVEVYNHGCHVESNTGHAALYWDSLLRRGKRVWGVATDDAHHRINDSPGGWVVVKAASLTIPAIIQSLREGRFYSSSGPSITDYGVRDGEVFIECSPVAEIHFVTYENRGRSFVCEGNRLMTSARHRLAGSEKYVRVECVDEHGKKAWTNPLFL